MQRLEFSGAVRLIYKSLGVKGLKLTQTQEDVVFVETSSSIFWDS